MVDTRNVDPSKIIESTKSFQQEIGADVYDGIITEKESEQQDVRKVVVNKSSRRVLKTPDRDIIKPTDELEKATPRTRNRTKSKSSNNATMETDATETKVEETKTLRTRKRSQSIASNKSEDKTPEKTETPSRRRAKTPTSAEVRRILTRRASKEIAEKVDEAEISIVDDIATPKHRSTRARSKDDEPGVASEQSTR